MIRVDDILMGIIFLLIFLKGCSKPHIKLTLKILFMKFKYINKFGLSRLSSIWVAIKVQKWGCYAQIIQHQGGQVGGF